MANRLASYLHRNRFGVYGLRITRPTDLAGKLSFREHRLTLRTTHRSAAKTLAYSLAAFVKHRMGCIRKMSEDDAKAASAGFLAEVAAERDRLLKAHDELAVQLIASDARKEEVGARFRQAIGSLGHEGGERVSVPLALRQLLGWTTDETDLSPREYAIEALSHELHVVQMEQESLLRRMAEIAGDSESLRLRVEAHSAKIQHEDAASREREALASYTASLLQRVGTPSNPVLPGPEISLSTMRAIQGLDPEAGKQSVTALFAMYFDAHRDEWKNFDDRVRRDYQPVRDAFIRFHGDLKIETLTLSHSRSFAEHVKTEERAKGNSTKTISKKLSFLCAVFNWAKEQTILQDLTAPLVLKADSTSYEPFAHPDLVVLFESEHYRDNSFGRAAQFWLPLLGLYTGARIDELASLKTTFVTMRDDIHGLQLSPEGLKTGKNDYSRRFVPLHSAVLGCGFLDYLACVRSEGRTDLFPCLPDAVRDGKGKAATRDFTDLRRSVGIGTSEGEGRGTKTYHSFRTTLISAMQSAGVHKEVRMAITGHASSDVHATVYSQGELPAAVKREALERVQFQFVHPRWVDTEAYRYARKNARVKGRSGGVQKPNKSSPLPAKVRSTS